MSAVLAQNWWLMALRGVFAVLFGLIALFAPGAALLSLALLFSAYMLVDGGARHRRRRAGGAAQRALGMADRRRPRQHRGGRDRLRLAGADGRRLRAPDRLLGLLSGGFMLAAAFRLKADHGRWWLALGGIASMVFGVLLLIAPLVGAVVLAWWLGAYSIVFGIMLLVLAFQLRGRKESRDGDRHDRSGRAPGA